MELGVFLPISGSATGPDTLAEAAQTAEAQGFDAVWSADRVVTPWKIETTYPYSESQQFIVPPEKPFLDSLTCLAFLAGVHEDDPARRERARAALSPPALLDARRRLHRAALARDG